MLMVTGGVDLIRIFDGSIAWRVIVPVSRLVVESRPVLSILTPCTLPKLGCQVTEVEMSWLPPLAKAVNFWLLPFWMFTGPAGVT